jgi:GNAT superfamily N-acetyltransferase
MLGGHSGTLADASVIPSCLVRAPELLIRPATADDAEELVRANEAAWNAGMAQIADQKLGELAPFEGRVARYREGIAAVPPGMRLWVAEREGRVVGHATVAVDDALGELSALYVVPEEWGSGVAGALLGEAVAGMRDLGATEATLWVVEGNTRARRFYEREGWSADGETKSSMFDIKEVRYRRLLDL